MLGRQMPATFNHREEHKGASTIKAMEPASLAHTQGGIYIDARLASTANTVILANAAIQETVTNVLSWTPAYAGATKDFTHSG